MRQTKPYAPGVGIATIHGDSRQVVGRTVKHHDPIHDSSQIMLLLLHWPLAPATSARRPYLPVRRFAAPQGHSVVQGDDLVHVLHRELEAMG
jgi:hypothetical protein